MSSPEAEAFDPEAAHDIPKLKGKAFEPFEEELSDQISLPKLEDVALDAEQDTLAEPPDTLADKINHLQDVQENMASRANGFTFKRTKSTERVDLVDTEGEVANGTDDNADLESEGGSHLPSPPGTPDDVLSVQASTPSSPGSNIIPRRASLQNIPTPSLRPFDRRFQSRLSISSPLLGSPRSASPALLNSHSRSSSLSGQGEDLEGDAEEPSTPWDVIRWTKLKKLKAQLYSESGHRAYGEPTCINIFTSIAVGTSRGFILIFDYHQTLMSVIGQNLKVECGGITSLAISADYTTIAGGYAKGYIFTWEIGKSARPFLSIPPIPLGEIDGKKEDGHVQGTSVLHLGFLGTRHTALVSADDKGMAFSHLASRSLVGRVVKTTRILGRYPFDIATATRPRKPSSVLGFASLPLGNAPQPTDTMGLTAMLTPYLLVIVSTTPIAQTQHKLARPKEVASEAALSGCLAWFPAIKLKNDGQRSNKSNQVMQPRLAYCWSNVLTVMEILHAEKEGVEIDPYKPPALQFRLKSRWKSDEAIVAVQWLNRQILCVVTVSQRLIIIEEPNMRATERFDLIPKHIYHHDYFARQLRSLVGSLDEEGSLHASIADAYYNSVKTFKGRIFLLGSFDMSVGALSNWADRLLALMEVGDFIGALKLATSFYLGGTEMITVGLPSDDDLRHTMVRDKLLDMMGASLRYAFGLTAQSVPIKEREQLQELATACITACMSMGTTDFLFETAFEAFEDGSAEGIFLETLEPLILNGELTYLPPTVVKSLISHYTSLGLESRLEEVICHLDPRTMDIHQVTGLCKEHGLYDALIYVWNQALSDYITPITEILALIIPLITPSDCAEVQSLNSTNALKIFPYLSYILTGRSYPTGEIMSDSEAISAKAMLYYFLFLGRSIQWPKGTSDYILTKTANHNNEPSFPYLRAILEFDAASFLSCLNEAFEDPFLNDDANSSNLSVSASFSELSEDQVFGRSVNRQYIVSILLEVMNPTEFTPHDTIYLDMFIARNLPKYPQYLLFPGSTLQRVLLGLCNYPGSDIAEDCQLSAEYLLSVYHPPDINLLIDAFVSAGFYRVLKTVFRTEKDYPRLMEMYFEDTDTLSTVFDCINELLRPASTLTAKQREEVKSVIKEHAKQLTDVDTEKAAETLSIAGPDLHHIVVSACAEEPEAQYKYLKVVFESSEKNKKGKIKNERNAITEYGSLLELYIRLMCSYDFEKVSRFIETLSPGDLKLDQVIPALEEKGAIDGVVLLMAREGLIKEAMKKLVQHLGVLESAFVGLLRGCVDDEEGYQENDNVGDMLTALQKFSKVGIWLCQGQMAALESRLRGSAGRTTLKKALNNKNSPLTAEEDLWLDLIDCVVHISKSATGVLRDSSNMSMMTPVSPSVASMSEMSSRPVSRASSKSQRSHYSMLGERRLLAATHRLVHDVFTALLSATSTGGQNTTSFLRILRAFLNRAAITSPSLADLRNVLASIFDTYTYEEQLLALSGKLLEKDLFLKVEDAATLRQQGWKPKSQLCEGCGKKLWGTGAAGGIYAAWEAKRIEAFEKSKDEKVEKEAKRERERFGSISKGKGKAMLAVLHDERSALPGVKENQPSGKDGEGDAATGQKEGEGDKEASKIIMVFHCGHIYHRSCLESLHKDETNDENGEAEETPFSPVSRHETNVEETGMRCVVCK
ncbi:Vacuolar protein sorting-associated protein 8 [Orbilia oligospora]|nr:Vacuolar protein sorting-associated protein 8 [Orbilia oligospora]KAF3238528.1 Vacuolar protein sorting-associated protein 8 [Orbilia oligospora]KAF3266830.1 Vacuolar protein sorting-associated protein 8 [Orbilia oligospora]